MLGKTLPICAMLCRFVAVSLGVAAALERHVIVWRLPAPAGCCTPGDPMFAGQVRACADDLAVYDGVCLQLTHHGQIIAVSAVLIMCAAA